MFYIENKKQKICKSTIFKENTRRYEIEPFLQVDIFSASRSDGSTRRDRFVSLGIVKRVWL